MSEDRLEEASIDEFSNFIFTPHNVDIFICSPLNISILFGTVTEFEGKVVGFQTVQITGDRPQLEAADRFFEEHNVPKIEVNF